MSTQETAVQQRKQTPGQLMLQATSTPYCTEKIEKVLGKGKNAELFVASLMEIYTADRSLQNYDPNLVIAECFKAAVLQLPLNKNLGFAYIVPYKGKPTFQLGYKGYIQLAMRTGQYQRLNDGIVYKGANVQADQLSGDVVIKDNEINDTPIGYFAYFRLNNGFEKCVYLTKEAAEAHGKKFSAAYKAGKETPWKTNFDEMAIKTCWRRLLSKYGIMSVEMQDGLSSDETETPARDQLKWETEENANQDFIDMETGEVTTSTAPDSAGPGQPESSGNADSPSVDDDPGY